LVEYSASRRESSADWNFDLLVAFDGDVDFNL
jgi:hypothetical protein